MKRWAQMVGGPNDGKTVEVCGPTLYEPIPRSGRFIMDDGRVPTATAFQTRAYRLERQTNDAGDVRWRYILEAR